MKADIEIFQEWNDKELNNGVFTENSHVGAAIAFAKYYYKQQLSINGVVHSKITALVTYWKWQESGHVMLDDTKNKTTKIVEVEKLTDINEMFTNLIDVKILK